jgi:hypothetical protein
MEVCVMCGVEEGMLHKEECEAEVCYQCGGQRIGCECNAERHPFIAYVIQCARCGEKWPEYFVVPNEEWNYYIEPHTRNHVLCSTCYGFIVKTTDHRRTP